MTSSAARCPRLPFHINSPRTPSNAALDLSRSDLADVRSSPAHLSVQIEVLIFYSFARGITVKLSPCLEGSFSTSGAK